MKPVAFLSRLRAKGKAWHTPSQTDPTVGLFRSMPRFSGFLYSDIKGTPLVFYTQRRSLGIFVNTYFKYIYQRYVKKCYTIHIEALST